MNRTVGSVLIFFIGIIVGMLIEFAVIYTKFYNEKIVSNNTNMGYSAENKENTNTEIKEEVKPTDYMFYKSNVELIDETRLENLSKFELEIAKNEIFARYGYDFSSESLREYFNKKSWYNRIEGKKIEVSQLSEIEQKNVNLIDKYLAKYKK